MSDAPFMPMFWRDFLTDTQALSEAEFTAYTRLLGMLWLAGGWLPDDEKRLARAVNMSVKKWRSARVGFDEKLTVSSGKVTQARLLSELEKVKMVSRKRSAAAQKRWSIEDDKPLKDNDSTNAKADAQQTHTQKEEGKPSSSAKGEVNHDGNERARKADAAPDHDAKDQPQADLLDKQNGSGSGNEPDRKADKANAARGCRVPDDFWPDGTTQRVFAECGGTDLGAWVEQFVDYWRGVSGAKGTKRDWQGTARNRIRSCFANGWAEPGLSAAAGRGRGGYDKPPGRKDLEDHFAAAARVGAEWGEGYEPPIRATTGRSGGMARH